MAVTPKELIEGKYAESTQTAQYTADALTAIIDKFDVTNTTASNVKFTCNIVSSGDTPSVINARINLRTIGPGETYLCPEIVGRVLEPGSYISTLAETASALTIAADGREVTVE